MFAEIHCTFHIMAWHGYNFSLCPVLEILWNLALMSKTAGSIVEAALKRDPHEVEFIQSVQEVVHALERVIAKNSQYVALKWKFIHCYASPSKAEVCSQVHNNLIRWF